MVMPVVINDFAIIAVSCSRPFMERMICLSPFVSVLTSNVLLTGQIETHTIDQARTIFDVNTFSLISLVTAVLPLMKKQRDGRIIVVTNQAGIQGIPFHEIYCASKFAVEGFMECVAPECLAFNIQ